MCKRVPVFPISTQVQVEVASGRQVFNLWDAPISFAKGHSKGLRSITEKKVLRVWNKLCHQKVIHCVMRVMFE